MKIRTSPVIAFSVGYLLGNILGSEAVQGMVGRFTRAGGRPRGTGTDSGPVDLITDKAGAAATLAIERMKDTVGTRLGWRDGDDAAETIAADLAEDLAAVLNSRRRHTATAGRSARVAVQASSR